MNPCIKTGCDVLLQYENGGNMKLHGDLYLVGDCVVLRYNPHTLEPAPTDDPDYDWAHAIFACGDAYENAIANPCYTPDILNLEGASVLIMKDVAILMHCDLLRDVNKAMGRPSGWRPSNASARYFSVTEDDEGKETRH